MGEGKNCDLCDVTDEPIDKTVLYGNSEDRIFLTTLWVRKF